MLFFRKKKAQIIENELINISAKLESIKINEYVALMGDTKKLLWKNFISGISKGIGIAIGISILGAILLVILKNIVALNLPVIGKFISDLIEIIESHRIK